jgi:hypothetical protein
VQDVDRGSSYHISPAKTLVRDTGIEPVTSSVSGKRSPAELIAPGVDQSRWRRESNPCARLCRPLPHHSATPPLGLMPLHPRADDGIRTRDPHLGKVMRYQLRYIRAQRTRSSPGAKRNSSPPYCGRTNLVGPAHSGPNTGHASLAPRCPRGGPVAQWKSVRFTRGRSLVRSQPGPPGVLPAHRLVIVGTRGPLGQKSPRLSAVYPQSRSASQPVERIRHTIEVGVVEVGIGVCGHHDRRVAHRYLQ